ncbi:DUF3967 domain-containing protein [Bacillus halotolerans]
MIIFDILIYHAATKQKKWWRFWK